MTYDEAKSYLMNRFPDRFKVDVYKDTNVEFVVIHWKPFNENELEIVSNGGFPWDLMVSQKAENFCKSETLEYKMFYKDPIGKIHKTKYDTITLGKITLDQFKSFVEEQLKLFGL